MSENSAAPLSNAALHDRVHDHPVPRRTGSMAVMVLLAIGAIGILIWVGLEPRLQRAGGGLRSLAAFPIATALAVLVFGIAHARGATRFGFWAAVAITGQGAMLQFIDAGNLVGYQHLRSPGRIAREVSPLAIGFVIVQAALVAWAGRGRLAAAGRWLVREMRFWQLAFIAVAFALSSAVLSPTVGAFAREVALATVLQFVALATVVVAVAALPRGIARPNAAPDDAEPPRVDRVALATAAWVVVVAGSLAYFSYQRHPHVPDEVAYLLHARYLAEGMLTMPAPPVPDAFSIYLMEYRGDRWFSVVPPGWPLALALGELVGASWLVNPMLAGACVLLSFAIVRGIYDRRTARLTMMLLATSPWFLFMSMSFMTHTLSLACTLLAAWAVMRLRADGRWRWPIIGGVALGVVGLTRPMEGAAVAVLLGLWALGPHWRRPRLAHATVLALSSIATVAATFPYNARFTGRATEFPLMAYTVREFPVGSNALGFGPDRGLGWPGLDPLPGHGALDVGINAQLNGAAMNTELLGWGTGSILLLATALLWMRKRREDWWMVTWLLTIVGIHSFYWFSGGPDFGARYWYLAIIPSLVLVARAIQEIAARVDAEQRTRSGWRAYAGALLLAASTVFAYVPWRAIDKYFHYRRMRPDVRELVAGGELGRALVLVRGLRHPDYASAGFYNPIDPGADAPIFAWDRSSETRASAIAAYPDRPVYLLNGPTVTGRGFELEAGPLTGAEILARDAGAAPPEGVR